MTERGGEKVAMLNWDAAKAKRGDFLHKEVSHVKVGCGRVQGALGLTPS